MYCNHNNLKNACFNCLHEKVEAFKSAIKKLGGLDFITDNIYEMRSSVEDEAQDAGINCSDHAKVIAYREGLEELEALLNGR